MNAPTNLQLGLIDSLRNHQIWVAFDELKQPYGIDNVIGVKTSAPRERLGTYEQAKALNKPYVGISFTEPIRIDGKLLICLDFDWKRSSNLKPDGAQTTFMDYLSSLGIAYETSHSTHGAHYWALIDESELPLRMALPDKREIEVFSGFPGQVANVLVTDYDATGSLISANLGDHLPNYQKLSPIVKKEAAQGDLTESSRIELIKALQHIPTTDYFVWLHVGMALKYELGDVGFKYWDAWSSTDVRYDTKEIIYKWNGFNRTGIGAGTIFYYAKEHGYKFPQTNPFEDYEIPEEIDQETGEIIADSDEVNEEPEEEITLAPYPGVMADTVQRGMAAAFKPQHNLVMLSALIGMSAACHGKYRFADNTRLNLYGVGIAATGWGKDSPRQVAIGIAKAAGAKIIGKAASGEGLEDNLEDYRGILSEVDEVAHLLEALNSKVKTPYLVTMALAFLALFSASAGTYHTRVKAKSKDNAEPKSVLHPCFSLFGFCTPEKLGQALTISNAEDGLMGRILFMNGVDAAPVRYTQPFILPPNAIAYANAIKAAFSFNGELTTIDVDANADDLLWEITQEYDHNRKQAGSPIELQVLIRSAEKLKRIAGVLAVWDNPSKPVIKLAHVHWGGEFVKLSNKAVLHFIDNHMASEEQISDANALLEIIKKILAKKYKAYNANEIAIIKAKLVPHSMALRLFRNGTNRMNKALQYLEETGEIVVGKPPEKLSLSSGPQSKVYKLQ